MLRLKNTRNTLVPFGRLPDELLVQIAMYFVPLYRQEHPRTLYAMAAAFRHLRAVVIGASELWADIDCDWPISLVQQHLARAGSHTLALRGHVSSLPSNHTMEVVRYVLPTLQFLAVFPFDKSSSTELMGHLRDTETHTLRSISIFTVGKPLTLGDAILSSSICSKLFSLQL
jgi:hypothetical protein